MSHFKYSEISTERVMISLMSSTSLQFDEDAPLPISTVPPNSNWNTKSLHVETLSVEATSVNITTQFVFDDWIPDVKPHPVAPFPTLTPVYFEPVNDQIRNWIGVCILIMVATVFTLCSARSLYKECRRTWPYSPLRRRLRRWFPSWFVEAPEPVVEFIHVNNPHDNPVFNPQYGLEDLEVENLHGHEKNPQDNDREPPQDPEENRRFSVQDPRRVTVLAFRAGRTTDVTVFKTRGKTTVLVNRT
ncbi:uncharacterized protein LOC121873100 [Homarus americanus]|uniref:uncharacterized protein LOC121873100 n=1 Tax=Homarus americanus TaxID=6706 RepID=UPI001C44A78C|nr:uncharacterized protein LOC121873100 [Homarus americanus]